jgi:hypothetical protein
MNQWQQAQARWKTRASLNPSQNLAEADHSEFDYDT